MSIGNPRPFTNIYVLDNNLNNVPFYTEGELYVSGSGLMSKYIDRDTTNIIDHPRYGTLLKTNDIVIRNGSDKLLYFIRRNDSVFKLKGQSIHIEKLIYYIESLTSIEFYLIDTQYNKLIIYLKVKQHLKDSTNEIQTQIETLFRKTTELRNISNQILFIDHVPLLSNGKVDRVQLLNYLNTPSLVAEDKNINTNSKNNKQILFDIIKNTLLKDTNFTYDDDLIYSLGLNSFQLINIFTKFNEQTNIKIDLFDAIDKGSINNILME
jgi:long-subunit acyl-CoA synthetase (AMP-forming)